VAAAVFLVGSVASTAAPQRILVQAPAAGVGSGVEKDRAASAAQTLALYLYDWFGEADGVRLVDESQARCAMGAVCGPAFVQRPEDVYRALCAIVGVDAAVLWEAREGAITLRVHRAAGVAERELPWRAAADAGVALKAATDWLVSELGVDAQASPLARGLGTGAPAMFEDYYVIERFGAPWVWNSGVERLNALRPYLQRLPQDRWAAAAIVRAGTTMSTDRRAVEKPAAYVMMVRQALPSLLGTEWEPDALAFCEANRHAPETVESDLLAMVRRLGQDEVESALEDAPDGTDRVLGGAGDAPVGEAATGVRATLDGVRTVAQQAGALRCLGAMKSKGALAHLVRVAKVKDPVIRRAAAGALAQYPAPAGAEELEALRRDPDAVTAFLAARGLARRGAAADDLARLAAAALKAQPGCAEALEVLAERATTAEAAALAASAAERRAERRALAVRGLLRAGALDAAGVQAALADPDASVVRAAAEALPEPGLAGQRERLTALANHPDPAIAEPVRARLAALRPAEPRARRQFELATEHPYVRRQLIEALAREASADAVADLEAATANADAHTRALALTRLADVAPGAARPHALRLVADPHRWVRLHAAAVAARVVQAGDAATLKAALAAESDAATRLYLEDASARAEGRPLPAPRPAANRVDPAQTRPFLCGHGPDCVESPMQGYYDLHYKPDEPARKAHAAGKVFLARANGTAGNPVQVFLEPALRDGFWLGLDREFGDLAALDGVVLGEESMYFRRWDAWDSGWRLFCREAGIDPRRVAGDRGKLTAAEQGAWWSWEQRVAIEGFNVMYDWIKLGYGKLRPGFQVCTFMPDQNGPCEFDREWKFDVGAGYYYETGNRHRYTQIRRFKTLWPDRPVLWLVDGAPTALHGGALNYRYKPLTSPLASPQMPPYADAVCAWLAGAHPGFFYAKLAMARTEKGGPKAIGVWVFLETISPSSLQPALDRMFAGVAEQYRTESEMKDVHAQQAVGGLDVKARDDEPIEIDEPDPEKDPFAVRVRAEREAVRLGLVLEQELVYDVARLLTGLPAPAATNDVLLVGDARAESGALRLPHRYDFLDDMNKLAGADLERYRFIGVAGADGVALRDDAIHAVSAWLKDTPGLLYVRGWLPTDATNEAPTVADLDGRLEAEWPWAKDIALAEKAYRIAGGGAKALDAGDPDTLVLWQGTGQKGAVLFDRSTLTPQELRGAIAKVKAERGVGVTFADPVGMALGGFPGVSAAASGGADPGGGFALAGVDLFTGVTNPVLAGGRGAAFVASEYRGPHAAAHGGVAVLCQRPLVATTPLENGLEVDCGGGWIQAAAAGSLEVRAGAALPEIATNQILSWMLLSREPGVARVRREPSEGEVTYVRAPGKITVLAK
jgi:hypothetical protein